MYCDDYKVYLMFFSNVWVLGSQMTVYINADVEACLFLLCYTLLLITKHMEDDFYWSIAGLET